MGYDAQLVLLRGFSRENDGGFLGGEEYPGSSFGVIFFPGRRGEFFAGKCL